MLIGKYTLFICLNIFLLNNSFAQDNDFLQTKSHLNVVIASEISLKKSTYLIDGLKNTVGLELPQLSEQDQQSFYKTRLDFLTQAAKTLQVLKWGFGLGVLIKDRFQFSSEKKQINKLLEVANNLDSDSRDALLLAIQRQAPMTEQKWSEQKKKSFTAKSDEVITKILNSLDCQLWKQAQVVAKANEFGVIVAVGIETEGGTRGGKGWGALTDIGISFGYNRDNKSLAIQIFHDWEPFKSTQMPLFFIAGLVTKAGLYVANQGRDLNAKGISFYPPMAPGFSSTTNRSFMAGFSSGITWPPSPIGDMLTYSNTLSQKILLRLTVSHLTKGFIRVQSDVLNQITKINFTSIKYLISNLRSSGSTNKCVDLFIN